MLHTMLCCGIWRVCVSLAGHSYTPPNPRNHPTVPAPPRQHTLHPPWLLLPAHLVRALTQDIFWFQIPVCNPWGQKSQ